MTSVKLSKLDKEIANQCWKREKEGGKFYPAWWISEKTEILGANLHNDAKDTADYYILQ